MRKIGATRSDPGWFYLKDKARVRGGGRCEYCGGEVVGGMADLHHRWYSPYEDTIEQLMYVHRRCHSYIHFGGKLMAFPDSLVARGDTGTKDTPLWRSYLNERTA
jgi:hypothetical protein